MRTMMRGLVACGLVAAACGPSPTPVAPKGGPRGLRASEHLDVANREDALAQQDAKVPDTRERTPGSLDYSTPGVPWVRAWNTGEDHARMARIHRSEAAALQAEFDEACASRSLADMTTSPLQRYGLGGTEIANGVVIYLSPKAGPPDRLVGDMRCHRAWMQLSPPENMAACPLDLPDIQVSARGDVDGITVTIVEPRASLVRELQQRAAADLEAAQARPMQHRSTP